MPKKPPSPPNSLPSPEIGGGGLKAPPPPTSPLSCSSSSSSEFEFAISLSPSSLSPSAPSSKRLCPADDLFYKGQLLPLHLSPRLHMVRSLLLSSSSSSSTTTSRDSSGSSSDSSLIASDLPPPLFDSPRLSSSSAPDDLPHIAPKLPRSHSNYLSSLATKFTSVFLRSKKDHTTTTTTVKDAIKKCVKKVKPLYHKLSSYHHHPKSRKAFSFSIGRDHHSHHHHNDNSKTTTSSKAPDPNPPLLNPTTKCGTIPREIYTHSFSGNLRYPRAKHCAMAMSCPSSIRSSPSHSGLLVNAGAYRQSSTSASMEELQSAIQGAIAHCKNTMKKEME